MAESKKSKSFPWTENPIRRRSRKREGKVREGRERQRESRLSDRGTESDEG